MIVTRIYADERGGSHFAAVEIPLAPATLFPQLPFRTTRFNSSNPIKLFAVPAELGEFEWHTAPERQLAVAVNGIVEYETTDGEVRRFGPGEIVLVEDTTGRGHATRFADGEQCFLHIPVPDDRPAAGAHVSQ
jgi:hypothetical protein